MSCRAVMWRAFAAWLGGCAAATATCAAAEVPGRIELTPEERQWVGDHPRVTVGFSPAYAPFSMPGAGGHLEGIDLDYLKLIAARTGLRFEPRVYRDWPTVEGEFAVGHVEMQTGLTGSKRQRSTMLLSQTYLRMPYVIVNRTDSPYLLRLEDLKGHRIGIPRGYLASGGEVEAALANSTVVEYQTMADVFEALAAGAVEATVTDTINAAYTIRSRHLTNLRLGSVVGEEAGLHFGVLPTEPVLAQIIDRAISSLTPEERRAIDERWVVVEARPGPWLLAFKMAATAVAVVLVVVLLIYWHNRRLKAELEVRRRIQRELEDAHARLATANDQKSALMRMIAHDIRSPLTGIVLALDTTRLAEPGETGLVRDSLARAGAAAKQLARLVNDLVDAQAVEAGQRAYRWAPVDAGALVNEALADHADAGALKRIRLVEEAEEPGMTIETDAAALRQIVGNLLSNAIKYTRRDSEVRVGLAWAGDKLRIAVRDQGQGVSAADRERIFLKYGRGSAAPTGGEKSTGLGLWIVEQLVADLQGSVRCESQQGEGATFIVELPRRAPPRAAAAL